jgi:hypothetical protein
MYQNNYFQIIRSGVDLHLLDSQFDSAILTQIARLGSCIETTIIHCSQEFEPKYNKHCDPKIESQYKTMFT